ncbi:MAG TPA: SH3 domain-containing protein [Pirellulales bacterium]|jgi:hypothetical protein|nr:SH3 domain-containing protein [Pirellulales bacterium]
MRFLVQAIGVYCTTAILGWTTAGARADQPEFPYTAYVSIDDAYVRSGAGKRYYPTDKLVRGDAVEVYRQDPGGWLAIRPPRKSFSWVPADVLQPTKNHLAIVAGDRVASHVGSRLNESRGVVQVRLERGEEVEIVAAEPLTINGQQELWCKIAPPSGEFRWIYGRFVDRIRPPPVVPSIAVEPLAPATPATAKPFVAPSDNAGANSDAFDSNLMAVDLALSAAVVQEMATWRFDDLERRAERVLDRAQTSDERNRARQLLDRIANFEDIKRRSDAIAGLDTGVDRRRLQLTAMTTAPAAPAWSNGVALTGAASRYDAVGKLTTVRSLRPHAPPFALLDANHEPIAFVTPMPGVDLRPLLGHQVGVSGQRGYMPEFKKAHITAMLAEPLDGSDVIMALRDQMRR